ncbi:MAG: 5'-nucleotidase C-terminal domain-containing protein [Peptoniphilus sp.]|nr:5'-nucleotidase C-terminal domain-containing protein [Peptoniphilus sp.]MDD7362591.1 5'-nucleotidase C-terminal domain-containing protein [Bacillota bacterium]MDY6045010.1 5'-nucleotidase C-terminal domain-containing protein [Peptoniphilus sp.]
MKKKFMSLFLALTMILGVIAGPVGVFAEGEGQDTKTITLLHTNDVHGHAMAETDKDGNLTNIGYAKVKTYADSIKNSVLLDAGDVTHGTVLAGVNEGKDIIDLMKTMGYKAMVPGNHDFNYGYDALVGFKDRAEPSDMDDSGFDILAANVVRATGGNDFKGQTILDVDGVKVGIFGLATEETKVKSNPKNTENVIFLDPIQVAKAQVKSLEEQGADVIVMLSHLGVDDETDIKSSDVAKAVDGIDVIIDGHSHTALENGKLVNGVLIAQTGGHLQQLGEVNISLRGHEVISKTAVLRDAKFFENVREDLDVSNTIDKILTDNKDALERVVGKTDVALEGAREHVRTEETNFGNLVTDAMRDVSGADVAITNGGGIRASIPEGDITVSHLWTSFPFGNTIMKIELTGADIVKALEHGVADAPAPEGKFPQVSGITFKYDTEQKAGERVFDVKVNGKALDPKATYTLATNDFMAVGGDGYDSFKNAKKLGDYGLYTEILEKYLTDHGTVSPKVEDRIVVQSKTGEKPQEPEKPNVPSTDFTDIKGHWAEDVIKTVTEKGLFKGMTETTFAPNTKISRGMLVSVLARLEGEDKKQDVKNEFSDVKAGTWYENGVLWAQKNKVVLGYEDGTFKPNKSVTREEMASILGRYLQHKNVPVTPKENAPFVDQRDISKWALEPLDVVRNTQVMKGREGNRFYPRYSATRAELAQVIYNLDRIVSANKEDQGKVQPKKDKMEKQNDKKSVDTKPSTEKSAAQKKAA